MYAYKIVKIWELVREIIRLFAGKIGNMYDEKGDCKRRHMRI
jgi:hypothetical protein